MTDGNGWRTCGWATSTNTIGWLPPTAWGSRRKRAVLRQEPRTCRRSAWTAGRAFPAIDRKGAEKHGRRPRGKKPPGSKNPGGFGVFFALPLFSRCLCCPCCPSYLCDPCARWTGAAFGRPREPRPGRARPNFDKIPAGRLSNRAKQRKARARRAEGPMAGPSPNRVRCVRRKRRVTEARIKGRRLFARMAVPTARPVRVPDARHGRAGFTGASQVRSGRPPNHRPSNCRPRLVDSPGGVNRRPPRFPVCRLFPDERRDNTGTG